MMIECGSTLNIILIKAMKNIGINVGDLSISKIIIQGLNQKGQRAMSMICLELQMRELIFSALFHVIYVKMSYELLIGHVQLHETEVVPSTWH